MTPVYENHAKPGAWTYTDFSQPPEIFTEIVRRTADVGLGVNFDTGNAATFAADPLALLDEVIGPRGQRPCVRLGRPRRAAARPAGHRGHAVSRLFERLARAGWDGWICMEEASFQVGGAWPASALGDGGMAQRHARATRCLPPDSAPGGKLSCEEHEPGWQAPGRADLPPPTGHPCQPFMNAHGWPCFPES